MIQSIYKRKSGEEYDPTRDRQKKEAETTEGQPHGIDVGTLAAPINIIKTSPQGDKRHTLSRYGTCLALILTSQQSPVAIYNENRA